MLNPDDLIRALAPYRSNVQVPLAIDDLISRLPDVTEATLRASPMVVIHQGQVSLTEEALATATAVWDSTLAADSTNRLLRYQSSPAHQAYNLEVYESERFQFNMLDKRQRQTALNLAALQTGETFVDLGCATGHLTEWIVEETGCEGLGIDFARGAIEDAKRRTQHKQNPRFVAGDLNYLDDAEVFGVVDVAFAFESLYFPYNLAVCLRGIGERLSSNGRLVATLTNVVPRPTLMVPDHTALGAVFSGLGWPWTATDCGASEHALWQRSRAALDSLRSVFEAEGNAEVWAERHAETNRMLKAYEDGRAGRWIYCASPEG